MPWWPFSMIATEAVCLVILIMLLKKEKKAFSSIQLKPFESLLALGKIAEYLNRKASENPLMNILKDILLFYHSAIAFGVSGNSAKWVFE